MTSLSELATIFKRKINHPVEPQKEVVGQKADPVVVMNTIDKRLIIGVMSHFQNAIEHVRHVP